MAILIKSALHLLNDSKPLGTGVWDWSIWVEGPESQLSEVESVTYFLHPTFPQPMQKVTDRVSKFRLRSRGWGEFAVKADAQLDNGRIVKLERWLELLDAEGKRPSDQIGVTGGRPAVFISASAVDGEFVIMLENALRKQGIDTRREQDMASAASVAASVDTALTDSDGVITVFSEPRSPWVEDEFERARALRKPIFPVILGRTYAPPGARQMERYELRGRQGVEALANTIAARLKDRLVPEE